MDVNVIINDGFYKKLNESNFRNAIVDTVRTTTTEADEDCRRECPVRTGNLRDSHYTVYEGDTGKVMNTAEYANTVIYGNETRSPNNYPQRVLNNMNGTYEEMFLKSLSQNGVL